MASSTEVGESRAGEAPDGMWGAGAVGGHGSLRPPSLQDGMVGQADLPIRLSVPEMSLGVGDRNDIEAAEPAPASVRYLVPDQGGREGP